MTLSTATRAHAHRDTQEHCAKLKSMNVRYNCVRTRPTASIWLTGIGASVEQDGRVNMVLDLMDVDSSMDK